MLAPFGALAEYWPWLEPVSMSMFWKVTFEASPGMVETTAPFWPRKVTAFVPVRLGAPWFPATTVSVLPAGAAL